MHVETSLSAAICIVFNQDLIRDQLFYNLKYCENVDIGYTFGFVHFMDIDIHQLFASWS